MEHGRFTRYLFLIVLVVAVVGLLNNGFLDTLTGFAAANAEKTVECITAEEALAKGEKDCTTAKKIYAQAQAGCDEYAQKYVKAEWDLVKKRISQKYFSQVKQGKDVYCDRIAPGKERIDARCAAVAELTAVKDAACTPPAEAVAANEVEQADVQEQAAIQVVQ